MSTICMEMSLIHNNVEIDYIQLLVSTKFTASASWVDPVSYKSSPVANWYLVGKVSGASLAPVLLGMTIVTFHLRATFSSTDKQIMSSLVRLTRAHEYEQYYVGFDLR